jgi:hypothetical protein
MSDGIRPHVSLYLNTLKKSSRQNDFENFTKIILSILTHHTMVVITMANLINPKLIHTDLDTQACVAINDDVVKEYMEAMEAGDIFPPFLVYFDKLNNRYILVDGFHHFEAHCRLHPNDTISVELKLGTLDEARWVSLGSNKNHGLRRTNTDKRNAIVNALKHPKGAELSDNQIEKYLSVDHKTIAAIRRELEVSCEILKIEPQTVQRGKQIYQQQTSRIGLSPPSQHSDSRNKTPNREISPPDCDFIEPCNKEDDTQLKHNPFQNRRLKNSIIVHLPPNNPQLFVVEL